MPGSEVLLAPPPPLFQAIHIIYFKERSSEIHFDQNRIVQSKNNQEQIDMIKRI